MEYGLRNGKIDGGKPIVLFDHKTPFIPTVLHGLSLEVATLEMLTDEGVGRQLFPSCADFFLPKAETSQCNEWESLSHPLSQRRSSSTHATIRNKLL